VRLHIARAVTGATHNQKDSVGAYIGSSSLEMLTEHTISLQTDESIIFFAWQLRARTRACIARGPPSQPIGVGASKLRLAGKGVQKFAAPALLAKALQRNVLQGASGTAGRAVMVLPLNKHRTTVCCSKCGAATKAPSLGQGN